MNFDLWKAGLPARSIRVWALPTLRVADEWLAPAGPNAVECDRLSFAGHHARGGVPRLLGTPAGSPWNNCLRRRTRFRDVGLS